MSVAKMRIASPKRVTIVMKASRSSGEAGRRAGARAGAASGCGGAAGGGASGASDDAVIGAGSLGARRGVRLDHRKGRVLEGGGEPGGSPGQPVGEADHRSVAEHRSGFVDARDVPFDVTCPGGPVE